MNKWLLVIVSFITLPAFATNSLAFNSLPDATLKTPVNDTLYLYYQIKNTSTLPQNLNIHYQSNVGQLSNESNLTTCQKTLSAGQFCTLVLSYQAPKETTTDKVTLSINQLSNTSTVSVDNALACHLLTVKDYQSHFCQSQYQIITNNTENVFINDINNVKQNQRLGGMFGSYQAGKQCHISCGYLDTTKEKKPNEHTVFEIASITKTFTTAILGKLQATGQLSVNEAIKDYLPNGSWEGESYGLTPNEKAVTFQQLATFSAGFIFSDAPTEPHTQANFVKDINQLDPSSNSSTAIYKDQALPTKNIYSNSSIGLLGQTLMAMDGYSQMNAADLNAWYCTHILDPLAMTESNVCTPEENQQGLCQVTNNACDGQSNWQNLSFAHGHNIENGNIVQSDDFPWVPWAPAGAMHSNTLDMVKYIIAALGDSDKQNKDLMDGLTLAMQQNDYLPAPEGTNTITNFPNEDDNTINQGYAWLLQTLQNDDESPVYYKAGSHAGFNSWLGLNKDKDYGLIMLFNTGPSKTEPESGIPSPLDLGLTVIRQTEVPH